VYFFVITHFNISFHAKIHYSHLKKIMKMKRTWFVYALSVLFAKGPLSMVGGASHAGIA